MRSMYAKPRPIRMLVGLSFSLLLSLLLSSFILPVQWLWPFWTFLVVCFWSTNLPIGLSFLYAFIAGILLDGLYNSLLGSHALAFVVLNYVMLKLTARLKHFPLMQQAMIILVLAVLYQAGLLSLQIWAHPGLSWMVILSPWLWVAPIFTALCWPPTCLLLERFSAFPDE